MKKVKKIVQIIFLILSIIYIVNFFIHNTESLRVISRIKITDLLIISSLTIVYFLIFSYRFKVVIEKCSKIYTPFWDLFRIFIQARFLNSMIPQLGNLFRGVVLKKKYKISYTNYISAFISFAWMDTSINLLIASIIIFILANKLLIGGYHASLLLLLAFLLISATPLLIHYLLRIISIKYPPISWMQTKLKQVTEISLNNIKDLNYMIKIITLGLLILIRTVTVYYILFNSFGVKPNIYSLVVFYVLFKVSGFIVITPGNIGIQEIAFGFLSKTFGIGMAEGILVSLTARVISTIIIIVGGILFGGLNILKHRKEYEKNLTD